MSEETQEQETTQGGDGKYGRLFTEDDVVELCRLAQEHGVEHGEQAPETIREVVQGYQGKFPKDEPLFLLRGQDKAAVNTIDEYEFQTNSSPDHKARVRQAYEAFERFGEENPDRMKDAD